MTPEEIQNRLIYRDGLMLILNKPGGLPVHAGPKGGENMEQYFDHLRFGLPRVPHLAHRLDRDTSGCLVLGRHAKALRKLGKLFQGGRIDKTYWAVVAGTPAEQQGTINKPLEKFKTQKGWTMRVSDTGQPSVTEYTVMGQKDGKTWLELTPKTGRTHQLRVHCKAMGWPILGDWLYGDENSGTTPPLYLHARSITVPLYPKKDPITAVAEPPEHLADFIKDLKPS